MKNKGLVAALLFLFIAEFGVLALFLGWNAAGGQDVVLINEVVRSVQGDWDALKDYRDQTGLSYVVLDADGEVRYRTGPGLSESVNQAIAHRDTILDIATGGSTPGRILFYNDSGENFRLRRRRVAVVLAAALLAQWGLCIGYVVYLNRVIIRPFQSLKGFAERIAGGNLDIPLKMDRQNLFGAFTESFDLMRSELRKARRAEAEANAAKKELVAKLSHDIKTPVASIKAASEVGAALALEPRIRENYSQIIRKADQIDGLITNLFSAALQELEQLPVTPGDMESGELKSLLENADYLHLAKVPSIPDCVLYADGFRLQQVFDNIFANSYKYAKTKIEVTILREEGRLTVALEDEGGGVGPEELPFLKEKFRRGNNAGEAEGAGLGLYISDYFMREMRGELSVENGVKGLRVTVRILLSGRI